MVKLKKTYITASNTESMNVDSRTLGVLLIVGILASMTTLSFYTSYTPEYVAPTSASTSGTINFEVVEPPEAIGEEISEGESGGG